MWGWWSSFSILQSFVLSTVSFALQVSWGPFYQLSMLLSVFLVFYSKICLLCKFIQGSLPLSLLSCLGEVFNSFGLGFCTSWKIWKKLHSSTCRYSLILAPSIEDSFFFWLYNYGLFVEKSGVHMCVNLFLGPYFKFIDPPVCFYANTIGF